MKRSNDLRRLTPLTAKAPLRRTALGRSQFSRSAKHANQKDQAQKPKRTTANGGGIPAHVRSALIARSGGFCEIALPGCAGLAIDPSHRKKTGAGGRRGQAAARHHVLSNVLHACRFCHERLHRGPAAAYAAGWMLREHQNPLAEPCVYRGIHVRLLDDGSVLTIDSNATEEAA